MAAAPPAWAAALCTLLVLDVGSRLVPLQFPEGPDPEMAAIRSEMEKMAKALERTTQRLAAAEVELRVLSSGAADAKNRTEAPILPSARRSLQRTGENQDGARQVNIYTRAMTRAPDGRGRRTQSARDCSAASLPDRMDEVATSCCDGPGDDCSGGAPSTCDASCAGTLLPFWLDCEAELDKSIRSAYHAVLRQCQDATVARAGLATAMQLQLECTDGTRVESCVPECDESLHGDLLLANIDGEDTKYSCQEHHGLFSWMGSSADGGYLGHDAIAFLSSLLAGASGAYRLSVTEDAEIHTSVLIQPGMDCRIAGSEALRHDLPSWGTGSFTVGNRALLSLVRIVLDQNARVEVLPGGDVSLAEMPLSSSQLVWPESAGSTIALSAVEIYAEPVPNGDACTGTGEVIPITDPASSGVIEFMPDGGTPDNSNCRKGAHGEATSHCVPLCTWTIQCPAEIEFTFFEVESGYDFVTVGDPTTLTRNDWLTGNLDPDRGIGPAGSTVFQPATVPAERWATHTTVQFYADIGVGSAGFRARYRCASDEAAGPLVTQTYTVADDGHSLESATPGALPYQCFDSHRVVSTEAWRNPRTWPTRSGNVVYSSDAHEFCETDSDPCSGGWCRFDGDGGNSLATSPDVSGSYAGVVKAWFSGWNVHDGQPPQDTVIPGSLPDPAEGVASAVICATDHSVDSDSALTCFTHWTAEIVNCVDFVLWRLPPIPTLHCPALYTTAPAMEMLSPTDASAKAACEDSPAAGRYWDHTSGRCTDRAEGPPLPAYLLLDSDGATCTLNGMRPITDVHTCSTAALELHLEDDGQQIDPHVRCVSHSTCIMTTSDADKPWGCSFHNSGDDPHELYLGTSQLADPASRSFHDGGDGRYRVLCTAPDVVAAMQDCRDAGRMWDTDHGECAEHGGQVAAGPEFMIVQGSGDTCAAHGMDPITDDAECRAANDALGLSGDSVSHDTNLGHPWGCYRHNSVVDRHELYLGTNSASQGRSTSDRKIICKARGH